MHEERRGHTDPAASAEELDATAIRANMEATRERISHDLDELGDRLSPQHIKQQIKDNVRDATIGRVEDMARGAADRVNEARRGMMDTVRENPVPAAIAAIGIGWLYMKGRQQDGSARNSHRDSYRYAPGAYSPMDAGYGAGDARRWSTENEPSGAIETVKEKASAVSEGMKQKVEDVAEGAQHAVQRVAHANRQQARRLEDTFRENPLAIGAATVAIGLAAGLAAPRTHIETKLVGEFRDDVVDQVSEKAGETAERAQHKVEQVLNESGGAQQLREGPR
jgi:ElaB/YqjD/DUF883 family membrane-anchored ribosome-binding protein